MLKRTQAAELSPRPGASPGLLRRRYSMPETIMRKYRLAQQRSDSDESGATTSPSPAPGSPARGCNTCASGTCAGCGSCCDAAPQRFARRDRELMRKSALMRRLWGRGTPPAAAAAPRCLCACADVCCGRATRSLDGSRSELRHVSPGGRSPHLSPQHSPRAPHSPKRQRLSSPRGFHASDELLRVDLADSSCRSHARATSSYIETVTVTDVFTDSDASPAYAASAAATAELQSDAAEDSPQGSGRSALHTDDLSLTDASDTFSTSVLTARETTGSPERKSCKLTSGSGHIDGRISERSASAENDESNVLPYERPLIVHGPAYELLEIVVSETVDTSSAPALDEESHTERDKAAAPTMKPLAVSRPMHNINIDEYVSNILVESLNSLTDQLECMNASIGGDRKISIVEKEIKVKLQNTGVNTIVHLSPTSNNQIIFGNEELCNNEETRDQCNNPRDAADTLVIRDDGLSAASNNNYTSADSQRDPPPDAFTALHHDNVNQAVLQQIQKLFQDELGNADSDMNYAANSMSGISHIEISNVDVYIDNDTQENVADNEVLSGVGAGNYYEHTQDALVVPRLSAMPHTDSMEVNTSSSEDAEIIGSDCTSLVDSLDDPNSPRSILLRRSFNGSRRSELVRSSIDVLDLLPESAYRSECSSREKGESFFIRIKDDNCDCEKENVVVADHMPEKIKQRLYRRHRKRELRMECARRGRVRQLKRDLDKQRHAHATARHEVHADCMAIINALIDDVIAKIAQDEYKYMRIKQKVNKIAPAKSDENVAKRNWKKDVEYLNGKDSRRTSRNSGGDAHDGHRKSNGHHVHGKLSLLTHPSLVSDERAPRRVYQKSEIHDGSKCIEILEILEYANSSQSSPETPNSDENHNHSLRNKKSRIPVPVYEKVQKISRKSGREPHDKSSSALIREKNEKTSQLLASMLLEALGPEETPPARRVPAPHEPRSRSNSLRFKRVFDIIPEEKSSLSVDSSNEDINHNRRASAPTLVDVPLDRTPTERPPSSDRRQSEPLTCEPTRNGNFKNVLPTDKDTRSAGTSPLIVEEKPTQRLRHQTTMTSPMVKSAATSPMRMSSAGTSRGRLPPPAAPPAAPARPPPAPRPAPGEGSEAARRTVRTIQSETGDPIIVGGDRARDASKSRRRDEQPPRPARPPPPASRTRGERGDPPKESAGGRDANLFVRKTDKRKVRTLSIERSEEETIQAQSVRLPECKRGGSGGDNGGGGSSSDSGESDGSLLCSLAPKWLSTHARHKRAARRRQHATVPASNDEKFTRSTTQDSQPPQVAGGVEQESCRQEGGGDGGGGGGSGGGWSVTVAGSCRAALPADLEMRLRFPHHQHQQQQQYHHQPQPPHHPPPRHHADDNLTSPNKQQSCSCRSCGGCGVCAGCEGGAARCGWTPASRGRLDAPPLPAPPAHHPLPHPHHQRLRQHPDSATLTLKMKKEAVDSSILATKSTRKSLETLPDLEAYRSSRTKTRSSMKTRRDYSLHCWLPEQGHAPIKSNGLSVLGCAIIPELKPRVPTMSERDLTRVYTPRHYLRL